MVLVSLYMSNKYCQCPIKYPKDIQFSKTNITHIIDKLKKRILPKELIIKTIVEAKVFA